MKLKLLAVAVAAAISTPAFAESEVKAKPGGGAKFTTDDVSIKVGGRLMYDIDWFDDEAFNGSPDSGSDSGSPTPLARK